MQLTGLVSVQSIDLIVIALSMMTLWLTLVRVVRMNTKGIVAILHVLRLEEDIGRVCRSVQKHRISTVSFVITELLVRLLS